MFQDKSIPKSSLKSTTTKLQFILVTRKVFSHGFAAMQMITRARFISAPFLLLLLAMSCMLEGKEVSLRNKDGKSLTVSLTTLDGDKLTVLRGSDKKQFVLSLAQLDETSRAKVSAWVKAGGGLSEQFEIEVQSGKTNRKVGTEDFDDKNVNIEPIVTVKNPHGSIATRAAKVTAVLLGRPVIARNAYYVFSTETFNLPSIPSSQTNTFEMKKVSRNYDDRGYSKFGARYLGWVVLVHDPEHGRILHMQSVPTPLAEKFGQQFLKLQAGKAYDENLEMMKNFNVYRD
jgi:hypothetical protein